MLDITLSLSRKNKMMLEFGIILCLMLIVSQQMGQKLYLMPGFGLKLIWALI